jgi:hypothetical protein
MKYKTDGVCECNRPAKIIDGMKKLDTVKENVIMLLKVDERCRNDDKWLEFRYARDIQKLTTLDNFEEWKKLPSFESIRRVRQFIQNTAGLFLPTEESVRVERGIKQEIFIKWIREERYIYGYSSEQIDERLSIGRGVAS